MNMISFKHCLGLLCLVCVLLADGIDSAAIKVSVTAYVEPCVNYTHMNMHNGRRSDEWTKTPQDSICDWREYPSTSWRRFEHDAGVQLSSRLVPFGQCGTQAPIWMNGTHPREADGIVSRQVCANFGDANTICNWTAEIQVKFCPSDINKHYYVYLLPNPTGCTLAYCVDGSTKKNCSEYGQVWNAAELRCDDIVASPPPTTPRATSTTSVGGTTTTMLPPLPGEWSGWSAWSTCSKSCDYGIRTRERTCRSLPCNGVGLETEICNAFNCDEIPEHKYNGITVLFSSKVESDDTMLQVVVNQESMLRMWHDDINVQCNADPESCCGKPLDSFVPIGKIIFVGYNDIFTAIGYPSPVGGDNKNVMLKYIAKLNAEIDELVCGRVTRSATTTYINAVILQTAVENSRLKIESETSLFVAGYTVPTPKPEDSGLPGWAIAIIVVASLTAVAGVVALSVFAFYHNRNAKNMDGRPEVQAEPKHELANSPSVYDQYDTIKDENPPPYDHYEQVD